MICGLIYIGLEVMLCVQNILLHDLVLRDGDDDVVKMTLTHNVSFLLQVHCFLSVRLYFYG